MASPIAFLAGVWRGSGRGQFPTMDAFDYEEEVRFLDFGVPALMYQQHAWTAEDGDLLHFEAGIWRCSPAGQLAVSVALPRVTEIAEGTITDGQIRLVATSAEPAAEPGSWRYSVSTTAAPTRSVTEWRWPRRRWPRSSSISRAGCDEPNRRSLTS